MYVSLKIFAAGVVFSSLSLATCKFRDGTDAKTKSITDDSFNGKKIFFGFGEGQNSGSPFSGLAAGVRFDLSHIRDLFVAQNGGGYAPQVMIADTQEQAFQIVTQLEAAGEAAGKDDMYIQYSATHGVEKMPPSGTNAPTVPGQTAVGGLPSFNLNFKKMADIILKMPAKEVIIFTMSCYSGGLTDELNKRKSEWQDRFKKEGRTLFVMTSSLPNELSKNANRLPSSLDALMAFDNSGTAFGDAITRALRGDADGTLGDRPDGFITLEELTSFVTSDLTKRNIQTPTVAGSFDPKLRFAKNPRINGGDSVTRPAGFVKDLEQVKTFDKNLNDYLTVATKIDSDEKAMKAIIDNAENAAGEELDGANFMKDYMVAMSQIEKADADCNKKLMAFVEASKNTELNKSMLDSGANAFQGCPEADRIRTSALVEQDAIKAKADGIIKNYTSPADRKTLADIDRRMPDQRTKMLQAQSMLHTSYIDYLGALSRILGVPVPPTLPLPPNPGPH